MPVKLSLSVEGYDQAMAGLADVKDLLTDWKPILQDIATYLTGQFMADFAMRGSLIGENWPELNPQYALKKAKEYPGRGILERTGFMSGAFTQDVQMTIATIENLAPYGNYHQQDDDGPVSTGKIPRRRFMAIGDIQYEEVNNRVKIIVGQRLATAFKYTQ